MWTLHYLTEALVGNIDRFLTEWAGEFNLWFSSSHVAIIYGVIAYFGAIIIHCFVHRGLHVLLAIDDFGYPVS